MNAKYLNQGGNRAAEVAIRPDAVQISRCNHDGGPGLVIAGVRRNSASVLLGNGGVTFLRGADCAPVAGRTPQMVDTPSNAPVRRHQAALIGLTRARRRRGAICCEDPSGILGLHRSRLPKSLIRLALCALLTPSISWPSEITVSVNTPPDVHPDGRCSLIEAIINANSDTAQHADCATGQDADTIVLPPDSTQELTVIDNSVPYGVTGLPIIASDITIQGNGSRIVRNSGAPAFRLMAVTGSLTLRNITLQGGLQDYAGAEHDIMHGGCAILIDQGRVKIEGSTLAYNSCNHRGGAIYNRYGWLSLSHTTLTNNMGSTGGCLAQYHGQAEISDCDIADNVAYLNDGGGIWSGASHLTIADSTVRGNRANYGGGIRQEWDSQTTIRNTSISDNHARTSGGGIENGAFSSLLIFGSTISENICDGNGGGVTGTSSHNGTIIVNSTISGNRAGRDGGGIRVWGEGTTTLTRSTVAFNQAQRGGGIYISNSPTVLSNTLVTGNTSSGSGPEISCTGDWCSRYALVNHHNLLGRDGISGLAGFTPGARDIVPKQRLSDILDPTLKNNGGPTPTHALLPGSVAIDAGDRDFEKVNYGKRDIFDQRGPGFLRRVGPHLDIGAFEVQP